MKLKYNILIIVSMLLIIGFILTIICDYKNYSVANSAPFRLNIYIRAIEFVIPSIIFLVIAYLKK